MHQAIASFYLDESGHWTAKLDCGHVLQLPYSPPATRNSWVLTTTGREDKIGVLVVCKTCVEGMSLQHQASALILPQAV
jgi:hypothetical protein